MHVDDGTLLAFLDGELPARERTAVAHHVGTCAECTGSLEELRAAADRLHGALRRIDAAEAMPAVAALRARAGSVRPLARRRLFAFEDRRALLRAATLILGFGALMASALPGSPVRDWVVGAWRDVADLLAGDEVAAPVSAPVPAPEEAAVPAGAGVSVLPANGQIRVIVSADPATRISVRLVDAERAAVHSAGGRSAPRFRTAPGRIEITADGGADIRIELPRSALSATVVVGGRTYLEKDAERLHLLMPAADTGGSEIVFRVGS